MNTKDIMTNMSESHDVSHPFNTNEDISTCLKSIEKRLTSIERRSDNFDRALMYVKQTRYKEITVPAHNNLSLPDYRSMISEELITAYRNATLRTCDVAMYPKILCDK